MFIPFILIVAIFILTFLEKWLSKNYYKRLLLWLKQGAMAESKPLLMGRWKEVGDYVSLVLKHKEQENQQNLEQLNRLLGAIKVSPNGILLLDEYNKIDWCNDTAERHFNLSIQQDLQQYITNLIRYPEFIHFLESNDYQVPLKLLIADGQTLQIQIYRYDEKRLLLLSSDITQLEHVDQMRRNFVADVSHEIRTPLTVLSGFIETIQTLPLEQAERDHFLSLMQQQAQRMQALVRDLLTLARLEDGQLPPFDQWVSTQVILDHTLHTVEELSAGKHQIIIQAKVEANIAGIESELISAVANIAVNAVRYTKEGGVITISFDIVNGSGIFTINDTGQGIAQNHIKHLTQRFYRIDKSRSRETGGTGLGLSIVKHVVLRHGGYLDIESIEGKGSTFSIILPVQRVKVLQV